MIGLLLMAGCCVAFGVIPGLTLELIDHLEGPTP